MSALCNVIPHFYYSALLYWSVSFLSLFLCLNITTLSLISKYVSLSFYSIRIASLQGNRGSFFYEVVNKNKIRQSWKILQSSFTLLHTIICLIIFLTLHNIPFGFKIFSIAKSYLIN